jgi:hypothetical protein
MNTAVELALLVDTAFTTILGSNATNRLRYSSAHLLFYVSSYLRI